MRRNMPLKSRIVKGLRAAKETRTRRKGDKVYIYSFGGCGTRLFYEFIKKHRYVNGQGDVHSGGVRRPLPTQRVIYLYGNPIDAVMSFYRREQREANFIKMHSMNLGVHPVQEKSIQDYAKRGKDSFGLKAHFRHYSSLKMHGHPMLLVRYENLWDNLEDVFSYLKLSAHDFPKYRRRSSSVADLDAHTRKHMMHIYGGLIEEMKRLRPVHEIRNQ